MDERRLVRRDASSPAWWSSAFHAAAASGYCFALLERDRRVHRQLRLLVELRRLGPLLLDLGEPRAQRDVLVAGELAARHVEVVQVQVDERGLARAAEVAIDVAEPAQPVVVLVVDDVGLADQLAVVALGLGPPALLDERLGLIGRALDRVERAARHQFSFGCTCIAAHARRLQASVDGAVDRRLLARRRARRVADDVERAALALGARGQRVARGRSASGRAAARTRAAGRDDGRHDDAVEERLLLERGHRARARCDTGRA